MVTVCVYIPKKVWFSCVIYHSHPELKDNHITFTLTHFTKSMERGRVAIGYHHLSVYIFFILFKGCNMSWKVFSAYLHFYFYIFPSTWCAVERTKLKIWFFLYHVISKLVLIVFLLDIFKLILKQEIFYKVHFILD